MMAEESKLPPRSPMPEWGVAMIQKYNEKVAMLIMQAGTEAIIVGLSAKAPPEDVRNHAISVMCQLATTTILATMERLVSEQPGVPVHVAADIIYGDVTLRFRRAIALAAGEVAGHG